MAETSDPAEKLREIFFAVGFAITQWQQVEMALTQLFVVLLQAKHESAGSAAFAVVPSFPTKLRMVDAACWVVLRDAPLFAEWRSIHNQLKNALERKRNEIAHFMLYQKAVVHTPDEPLPTPEELYRQIDWYLAPSAFCGTIRHKHPDGLPSVTADEVKNRGNAFLEAANQLWTFSEKVRAHLMTKG